MKTQEYSKERYTLPPTDATSGSNLRVSEGDTVTTEYSDTTLPEPYT